MVGFRATYEHFTEKGNRKRRTQLIEIDAWNMELTEEQTFQAAVYSAFRGKGSNEQLVKVEYIYS